MNPPNATADHLRRLLAKAPCALEQRETRDQAHAFIDGHDPRRPLALDAAEGFVT